MSASTDVPHRTTLSFTYPDERRARLIAAAVDVETGEIVRESAASEADARSSASVSQEGRAVEVTVGARDLVALRASVNTWCRLVAVAERVSA